MGLKTNINKIHVNLKDAFNDVTISEKSDRKFGNYFELEIVSEGKKLRMVSNKNSLEGNVFDWKYYSDPTDEDSFLVERTSDVNSIVYHIEEIFTKNRFDKDYLKNI
jgi:hypothetical protein